MKRLFPVLHLKNKDQALLNTEMVVNSGAYGIFLIHHGASYNTLIKLAAEIHEKFPNLWIGINALDKSPEEVFKLIPDWVKGVWCDECGVVEREGVLNAKRASDIWDAKCNIAQKLELFQGFAFKYQALVLQLQGGAFTASFYCDVVTTSGDGTGIAADINKIKKIKEGALTRLAIASGITPENYKDYAPYVDDYLVATGIGEDFYNFDYKKLVSLQKQIEESNKE
jgi:predicted TIM-barrel enzyme